MLDPLKLLASEALVFLDIIVFKFDLFSTMVIIIDILIYPKFEDNGMSPDRSLIGRIRRNTTKISLFKEKNRDLARKFLKQGRFDMQISRRCVLCAIICDPAKIFYKYILL